MHKVNKLAFDIYLKKLLCAKGYFCAFLTIITSNKLYLRMFFFNKTEYLAQTTLEEILKCAE
ncbi:hypothetical protein SKL01_15780 [Staphylococcus kloosii]|uniref:Uncharacterized protein n=1 Tax=Staphylococcus kloosii TaxID=29384 RepID=A0ABQ0XLZ9_9STAP|nr:hypothetical protein SKL01_15780 [Staphylococcus kloosii]